MNLANLIQTISDWQNKTAAEVAAELNAETVEARDDQMYTWAGVAVAIGSNEADALRVFMEGNGLGWAVHQLGGTGIQLSYPATQDMLTNLIAAGVTGCDTLKWIGIHYVSPYVNDGGEGDVSETDVQAAMDSLILSARIVNATALANERLPSAADQAAAWAQCWQDAV